MYLCAASKQVNFDQIIYLMLKPCEKALLDPTNKPTK